LNHLLLLKTQYDKVKLFVSISVKSFVISAAVTDSVATAAAAILSRLFFI